jgi:hypothetical protein
VRKNYRQKSQYKTRYRVNVVIKTHLPVEAKSFEEAEDMVERFIRTRPKEFIKHVTSATITAHQ